MADASALVELLAMPAPDAALVLRLASEPLHAPQLVDLEVLNGFRNLLYRQTIDQAEALNALVDFEALDVTRYLHEPMRRRIWELRGNLTPYDASYVALAEALGAPLVTVDARLAASPNLPVPVELFPRR